MIKNNNCVNNSQLQHLWVTSFFMEKKIRILSQCDQHLTFRKILEAVLSAVAMHQQEDCDIFLAFSSFSGMVWCRKWLFPSIVLKGFLSLFCALSMAAKLTIIVIVFKKIYTCTNTVLPEIIQLKIVVMVWHLPSVLLQLVSSHN